MHDYPCAELGTLLNFNSTNNDYSITLCKYRQTKWLSLYFRTKESIEAYI